MDAWVGIINSVTSDVELQFADGSCCLLTDEEAAELDDPSGRRLTVGRGRGGEGGGQLATVSALV